MGDEEAGTFPAGVLVLENAIASPTNDHALPKRVTNRITRFGPRAFTRERGRNSEDTESAIGARGVAGCVHVHERPGRSPVSRTGGLQRYATPQVVCNVHTSCDSGMRME